MKQRYPFLILLAFAAILGVVGSSAALRSQASRLMISFVAFEMDSVVEGEADWLEEDSDPEIGCCGSSDERALLEFAGTGRTCPEQARAIPLAHYALGWILPLRI